MSDVHTFSSEISLWRSRPVLGMLRQAERHNDALRHAAKLTSYTINYQRGNGTYAGHAQ